LSKQNFKQIFDTITRIYPNWRTVVEEVAIEVSPDSIVDDPEVVPFLMSCGLTRMNMGIQSLQHAELREAGRSAANETTIRKAISIVKEHHLPNLSTDLIMGFSGQNDDTWRMSVEELASLRPDTISTYFLTIRPDAWFHKTGKYEYMRDPRLYERYEYARAIFQGAGYVQESNVRYKIPGRGGYQQKVLQFRGVPYLGIGAGARTYTNTVDYLIGGSHKPHISQIEDYIRAVNEGTLTISSGFVYSEEERIRKRLVLDNFDLNLRDLERYNFQQHRHLFQGVLDEAVRIGLMVKAGEDKYQLLPKGFKYRDILSWHLYSDRVVALDREFYQVIQDKTAAPLAPVNTLKGKSSVSAG
jgi:oxygen-independent coproporphyrinogen-3 oxidase